jgi:sporulation protein YlmC with PRC-barrel domain
MRLSDLRNAKIRTLDGETLGRVHEVHCEGGQVVAVMCGPASLIERLTAKKRGLRIAWECVRKIERGEIFVARDPPTGKAAGKPNASRTRQGTRQPSAPRLKR